MKVRRRSWAVGLIVALVRGGAVVAGLVAAGAAAAAGTVCRGQLIDGESGQPIAGALVTADTAVVQTDPQGAFEIETAASRLLVRAVGYARRTIDAAELGPSGAQVALVPFTPKALYLSFYGIGSTALRETALALIERTELNALVIDVKGDHGKIPYQSSVPLAADVGAQRPRTIADIGRLLDSLHARGIYLIARIVVFKDHPLAMSRPDLAVHRVGGAVWRDREHLAWTDPFLEAVWDYNIDIAEEAARSGFDEIQFDYVRFPDAKGLVYAKISSQESRVAAIAGFLQKARARLTRYNVFLAADVFGYVCWNLNDTAIGQRLEDLAPTLDIVSPMLYPSSFQFGIPGYRWSVAYPYEIVYLSLGRAQQRTGLPPSHLRPWLQAFRDYGFDRRVFGATEIRAQIDAAENAGTNGWMLWNPHNVYSAAGLHRDAE